MIAKLEGGFRSIATASGLAAISGTFLAFLESGDHALVVDSIYDPVRRFCTRVLAKRGIEVTYYDPTIGAGIAGLFRDNTKLVFMESPGSGTFEIQDIRAIAAIARERGAVSAIDSTWATPLFLKPLSLGVDISIHAATKYIVGHSDAMLGVVTANEKCFPPLRAMLQDLGACAGSEECYLALRGMRTLELRLERHQRTALALAGWLAEQPQVLRVWHPGLASTPGHDLWKRDFTGATGLFGVEIDTTDKVAVARMIDGFRFFRLGLSWGGFESLVSIVHPEKSRVAVPWTGKGTLLRLHAGLEGEADLLQDLKDGLGRL
jgi:cystathionine beta-lyase